MASRSKSRRPVRKLQLILHIQRRNNQLLSASTRSWKSGSSSENCAGSVLRGPHRGGLRWVGI